MFELNFATIEPQAANPTKRHSFLRSKHGTSYDKEISVLGAPRRVIPVALKAHCTLLNEEDLHTTHPVGGIQL